MKLRYLLLFLFVFFISLNIVNAQESCSTGECGSASGLNGGGVTSASTTSTSYGLTSTSGTGNSVEPQLNTGASKHRIEINSPKVIGGKIEPLIDITYNSQRGNGLLGVGWHLLEYYIELQRHNLRIRNSKYMLANSE